MKAGTERRKVFLGRSLLRRIVIVAIVLTLKTTSVAAVLFDNGPLSDTPNGRYNCIVANVPRNQARMFDDFVLDHTVIIRGFNWKQHDYFDTRYISTEVTIYSDIPSDDSLLHSQTLIASRLRNFTTVPFWGLSGYDYSVSNLFLKLDPGHYWLGLNAITTADYAYGITSWDSSTGNDSTLRGRYQTAYLHPGSLPGIFYAEEDSVFQVIGNIVPELSTFSLTACSLLSLTMFRVRHLRIEDAPAPRCRPTLRVGARTRRG